MNNLVYEALLITNNSYMHFKHAALIIKKGFVISSGFNSQRKHAEIDAIEKLYNVYMSKKRRNGSKCFNRYLRKCDMLIVRGNLNCSKPCARCLDDIKRLGIKRIYYSYDGTTELKSEKVYLMENSHLSSKYRIPWSDFNNL